MENYFTELYKVNVNDKVEKKNGLSYVSWPYAWAEVKKRHPDATFTVYEHDGQFGPVNYFTDGRTCWVKTGVTINGLEHIEYLPVMDYKNRSIPYDNVTSMDVNKAIQRSLTKAVARHGLGLYIYAGEDLPEDAEPEAKPEAKPSAAPREATATVSTMSPEEALKNARAETLNAMCGRLNMTFEQFNQAWQAVTIAGMSVKKHWAKMTDAEFVNLMDAIEKNFRPAEGAA